MGTSGVKQGFEGFHCRCINYLDRQFVGHVEALSQIQSELLHLSQCVVRWDGIHEKHIQGVAGKMLGVS